MARTPLRNIRDLEQRFEAIRQHERDCLARHDAFVNGTMPFDAYRKAKEQDDMNLRHLLLDIRISLLYREGDHKKAMADVRPRSTHLEIVGSQGQPPALLPSDI